MNSKDSIVVKKIEQHVTKHILLHQAFDELFADFFDKTGKNLDASIGELIEWSYQQTICPDHKDTKYE